MKRAWQKKELWLLIGISLLVGSLIHFPELLSLTDAWGNKQLFQHLSPRGGVGRDCLCVVLFLVVVSH